MSPEITDCSYAAPSRGGGVGCAPAARGLLGVERLVDHFVPVFLIFAGLTMRDIAAPAGPRRPWSLAGGRACSFARDRPSTGGEPTGRQPAPAPPAPKAGP